LLAARMGAMMTMRAMSSTTITQHIFLRTFFWYLVGARARARARARVGVGVGVGVGGWGWGWGWGWG
jgi:hypothetical protein